MTVCVLMTHVYTLKHKKKELFLYPQYQPNFYYFPLLLLNVSYHVRTLEKQCIYIYIFFF